MTEQSALEERIDLLYIEFKATSKKSKQHVYLKNLIESYTALYEQVTKKPYRREWRE